MFTEDIEIGAALYEYHLEEMERKQAKLEKRKLMISMSIT